MPEWLVGWISNARLLADRHGVDPVVFHVLHDLFRPILISRIGEHTRDEHGATLLSAESFSRRIATMIAAPTLGFAVDRVRDRGPGGEYWPLGIAGFVAALVILLLRRFYAERASTV